MDTTVNRFERAAKWVIYVFAGLLPVWFIPSPIGVEVGREATFAILVILAGILWLVSVLTSGEIYFRHSPVTWFGLGLLVTTIVSTAFSRSPMLSAAFSDAYAERLSTIVLGLLLVFVASSVLRRRGEAAIASLVLIGSSTISALATLFQLLFGFSIWKIFASFADGKEFNVVGTTNGLMLFYAAMLAIALGIVASGIHREWPKWLRWGLWAAGGLFSLDLLLVNFRTSWVILAVASVFLFAFAFKGIRARYQAFDGGGGARFMMRDPRYVVALVALSLSLVLIFVRGAILKETGLAAEISPSFSATMSITGAVYQEGVKTMLIGAGPGTFGFLWSQYRDPALNLTPFWNARFNQGDSWASTLPATTGVAGALAFVLFLAAALFLFMKLIVVSRDDETGFSGGVFLGVVVLVAAAFLYGSNLTLALTLFFLIAIVLAFLGSAGGVRVETERAYTDAEGNVAVSEEVEERKGSGFWSISDKSVMLGSPWSVFLSSLVTIFFLAVGVAALYFETGNLRAAFARQTGIAAFNAGNVDEAIGHFTRSLSIGGNSYHAYQLLLQARLAKVQTLLNQAAGGAAVQQQFQTEVAATIEDARKATELHPGEPLLWRSQGALYALITPFIQGSERFAEEHYGKATSLDPLNPTLWLELGQAMLGYADRLALEANQLTGAERTSRIEARTAALEKAERAFGKAAEVKPDFASAHFLLAQTAIRLGNLASAIRATENAKVTAPFDVGVAFQLGILYFQAGNLDSARGEFERAISLNAQYSNARYFLGLIYDRQGRREDSIAQFVEVEKFNPDNQEVKSILTNLRAGKGALAGIVPPGTPPTQRAEPPIK